MPQTKSLTDRPSALWRQYCPRKGAADDGDGAVVAPSKTDLFDRRWYSRGICLEDEIANSL